MKHEHTVLIVEDESDVRDWLTESLKFSFSLVHARTIKEAAEILHKENISAVLLDLKLPNGEGKMLVETLRNSFPAIPIVCMSGYTYTADEMISVGAHDFMMKPCSGAVIIEKLTNTISRNKAWARIAPLAQLTKEYA